MRVSTAVLRCTTSAGNWRSLLGASRNKSAMLRMICSNKAGRLQSVSKDSQIVCTVSG